jgi:uncharacterized membrane protein
MTWADRFRVRQYLTNSLWVIPLTGGLLGFALANASILVEGIDLPNGWDYSSSTALTVLTTVIAATVGLTGFVVTVSVLVVQMATGTFSARYMRLWYRDRVLKAVLAVLIGTFSFSFSLLRRIGDSVPDLGVTLSGIFLGFGLLLFLVFLDRFVHRLRPVAVASLVAHAGRRSLAATAAMSSTARHGAAEELPPLGAPALGVTSGESGAIQAVDDRGLVSWASAHDCVLVLRYAAGDFVLRGAGLVSVHGDVADLAPAERELRGLIALGNERTIEQDPAFALRILVDIAIRALSPAVNDPTTAVQVINYLEDLLTAIGTTPGLHGRWELRDAGGGLRVVIPAHRWEDFLALGITEIREYGTHAIQVVRRLRAALEALRANVLPDYVDAVEQELARLDATVAAGFGETVDRDRAVVLDRQGIGGPPGIPG